MAITSADYQKKFSRIAGETLFPWLRDATQRRVRAWAERFRFTNQELRLVCERMRDLEMWGAPFAEPAISADAEGIAAKAGFLRSLERFHGGLVIDGPDFTVAATADVTPPKLRSRALEKERLGLGRCPVASERTRCCNLLTLDAVENCGFGCSYCSIQSFYGEREVRFDRGFADKLAGLELDPSRTYHIGTGQSSDSLMWGNSHGVLEALWAFAERYPNVILELKSKSDNIAWLLKHPPPPNVICTWSLNPQPVIEAEELGAASLARRLRAARAVADLGVLVGFHFHPMVRHDGWRDAYRGIADDIQRRFAPREAVLVSIGALTFIKPVLKRLRREGRPSRILQMPLSESAGKWSYPVPIKVEMFRALYQAFDETWRREVFFYLCMEDHTLWRQVFGHEYADNAALERAMLGRYSARIGEAAARRRGAS